MKVLVDINHPAHAHFFRYPIQQLKAAGHDVLVTSRDKEVTLALLDAMNIDHLPLSALGGSGLWSLGKELVQRDWALWRTAAKFKPDVMGAIGGTFIAHVGALTRVPSLVFYDTENASLQNAITYPLAGCVIAPQCYQGKLPKRHIRYRGYHELSYLHPDNFSADREVAIANGLAPEGDTFLLRLVSWQANHDVGENGWSEALLAHIVGLLEPRGKVLISSEAPLPERFSRFRYSGDPAKMHHLMAFCRALIGESATMASECAVLGVPSVYAANTGRGYTDEQESRYGIVRNVSRLNATDLEAAMTAILEKPREHWSAVRSQLLADTVDVASFVTECLTTWPAPLQRYQAR